MDWGGRLVGRGKLVKEREGFGEGEGLRGTWIGEDGLGQGNVYEEGDGLLEGWVFGGDWLGKGKRWGERCIGLEMGWGVGWVGIGGMGMEMGWRGRRVGERDGLGWQMSWGREKLKLLPPDVTL